MKTSCGARIFGVLVGVLVVALAVALILSAGETGPTASAAYWTTIYDDDNFRNFVTTDCNGSTGSDFSCGEWRPEWPKAYPTPTVSAPDFSDENNNTVPKECACGNATTEDETAKSNMVHYLSEPITCTNQVYFTLDFNDRGGDSGDWSHFVAKARFVDEDDPPTYTWKQCSIPEQDDDCNVAAPSGVGTEKIDRIKLNINHFDASPDWDKSVSINSFDVSCSNN